MNNREIEVVKKTRPYWHVDAKWICGLLFLFFFGLTVFFFNLYKITERSSAIEASTHFLAALFSPDGIDSSRDIEKIRSDFSANPGKELRPFPGLDIVVTEEDLDGSPRELRLNLFRQLATPIYDTGELAGKVDTNGAEQEQSLDIGMLKFISSQSHHTIRVVLIVLSIVSFLLLAGLVLFSFGVGRLVSPGIIILILSIPGLAISFFLKTISNKPFPLESLNSESFMPKISYIASLVLPILVGVVYENYLVLTILGASLLILSLIIKIVLSSRSNNAPN